VKVGKNSGPVLSHLWTKVHEILEQSRRLFIRGQRSRSQGLTKLKHNMCYN